VRYRLPVLAAPLVFLLTGREKPWLGVWAPMREPSVHGGCCLGQAEAFEGECPAPQEALVPWGETEARIGGGQSVRVVGEAAVRLGKISPGA